MRNVPLRLSAVVVCAIVILCSSVVARAQTVDGGFDPGANQIVNTIAMQPDGKIVVGGNFTMLGGTTGTTTRSGIGRLNLDGTVDTFNPGTNGPVYAVAVQPDGKILAGGNFLSAGGGDGLLHPRSRIVRFNADGSVDTTFNPGANLNVYALAVQADGKILVGGNFSTLSGATRIAIGRLNADGSIDSGFNPGASKLPSPGAPPEVYTIVIQPDGKILLGGYFNGLGGGTGTTPRNFIGRLLANGDVDTFNPGVTSISGVNAIAVQADGKIVVGGTYTQLGGSNRANIGRLDAAGVLDIGFNPGAETQVNTLAVQIDGKIIVGGYFKWMGDAGGPLKSVRNYIGRLNANGTVDGSFDPGANNAVNTVALHANGAIVAGGLFDRLGNGGSLVAGVGTLRNRIGRITNNNAGLQTLTLSSDGTVETWLRSGGGPEVSRVTFEFSFDGSFYSFIGDGTRITGGWQLTTGPNLPTTRRMWVRARGYHESGRNGSGSIVESILVLGSETDGDYDGDGKSDQVVFRPSTGTWYTLGSLAATVTPVQFGLSSDIPVPGDYDGNGFTNIAVYRPDTSTWFIRQDASSFTSFQFGLVGDVPIPSDYDGDLKTDVAVFRPSSHEWFIFQSSTNTLFTMAFGVEGDVPVPADYDGDGKADIAIFRPSTGEWFIRQSSSLMTVSIQFGLDIDVPVPGDYDGDDKADIAVYRPAAGTWFILQSSTNSTSYVSFQWGQAGDIAQPGDYDGDGNYDLAVFRPSTATWYIKQSSTGYATFVTTQLGSTGDIAVPSAVMANAITTTQFGTQSSLANLTPFNDFDGDGQADITVYRPSAGTWFNLMSGGNYTTFTSTQFGLPGDVPVPGDYDGDDKADIAIFRPGGTWYILKSSDSTFAATQWGVSGDIPVPGDYDGDGETDIAIFRPGSGTWYILKSSDQSLLALQWGVSGDIPVPGDYDGDGTSDFTVFRPGTGTWYIRKSSDSTLMAHAWGVSTDVPVPGDYDGDGKSDIAVLRPGTGTWYVLKSSDSTLMAHAWGLSGDIAVPGDYDGDGKTDIAVFRPTAGTWYFLKSSSNHTSSGNYQFGQNGDIPILKRP